MNKKTSTSDVIDIPQSDCASWIGLFLPMSFGPMEEEGHVLPFHSICYKSGEMCPGYK